jgi:hypothetical protein
MTSAKDDAIGVGIFSAFAVCGFSFMLWTIIRVVKDFFFTKALKKKLQKQYANLSEEEKAVITNLEEEIKDTLDVNAPGRGKAIDAWRTWSEEDRKGLKLWLPIQNGGSVNLFRTSPYVFVRSFLMKAEEAMRQETWAMAALQDKTEDVQKAIRLAALMRAVYWPEEVAKAKEKKAKREGFSLEELDAQV